MSSPRRRTAGRCRRARGSCRCRLREDAGDRKALLLRLAETGARQLGASPADLPLGERLRPHAGRWVAIRDDRLLYAADDAGAVARWLREHDERADQLYRVPRDATEVGGEHGARA